MSRGKKSRSIFDGLDFLGDILSPLKENWFEEEDDDDDGSSEWLPSVDDCLQEWLDLSQTLIFAHSTSVRVGSPDTENDVKIHFINPHGEIKGSVFSGRKKHRVLLTFSASERTYHCECNCRKNGLCEHTYSFARYIAQQLTDETSELFRKIVGPDYFEHRRKAQQEELRYLMDRAIKVAPRKEEISLDVRKPEKGILVSWNLSSQQRHHEESFALNPVLHKELKNGKWSKGAEISLEKFSNLSESQISTFDRRMMGAIGISRHYFGDRELNHAKAFELLAGTDRFLIEKATADLRIESFEFIVVETDTEYRLSSSVSEYFGADKLFTDYATFDGCVLLVNESAQKAIVMFAPDPAIELCVALQDDPVCFKKEEKQELLEQIKPLQQSYAVRLPDEFIEKERSCEMDLTLLLQLQKSGYLDVTVCFRKDNEDLTLPGEGLACETKEENGKLIQIVRDLSTERCEAEDLARSLNLNRSPQLSNSRFRIEEQQDIFDFLADVGERVGREDVKVVWHKATANQYDVLGKLTANNVQVHVERKKDWFGLDGHCRIGNQEIPLKDLLGGVRGQSVNGLLEVQPGKWAMVAEELRRTLQRLADVSNESRGSLRLDASAALTVGQLEDAHIQFEADQAWQKTLKRVRHAKEIQPEPPAAMDCELRDYQVDGFKWMCRLAEWGVGGILADDMGLGKTVQALAMLLQRFESGPALVIAPTSLGFNWQQECARFAPSLSPLLFRDSDRESLVKSASEGDVVICSYGLALRETDLLKSIKWGTLILDEAQNIKNANSKTAKQIRQLKAGWKVALTGTPVENHLGELWSIFHSVAPGVLGGWEQFRKRFALPIEKHQDLERRTALAQVISPFILRREKKDVLQDLPDLDEVNLHVELSAEERKRYDQMRLAAVTELDELGTEEFSNDQRFRVLQILTRLRQLACHIGLVDGGWEGSSAKLELLMERLQQLKERGHRPLVFSQFTSHLALIRQACDAVGISYQYLDGKTTPKARQQRVEQFQNGEGDAFLISLKAGGTGLNLTAADYVIHMDPWWNPAVEDQATDRAHRIGQTKNVTVYRIIAKDTIEEQILKLHDDKRDLVDGILAGAEAAGKLSTEELAELIRWGGEATPIKGLAK